MIFQDEYWFNVLPSRGRSSASLDGKWLYFGPTNELHSWLDRLNKLVEDDQIPAAKVARKLPGSDPFPDKPCVLCAFTAGDEVSKAHTQQVLRDAFNIEVSVWKSNEQTQKDWMPGGWLRLEAEINQLRLRIRDEGLGRAHRARLQRMAADLIETIGEIDEPSRLAEIEISRTTKWGEVIRMAKMKVE
jgi:hypothetical protein